MSNKQNIPRILFLDLESTPHAGYFWNRKWQTDIIETTDYMRVLSYSVKWLNGKQITKGWPDYKGYKRGKLDDSAIVKDLWDLLNEAEIIVAQNGKSYDIKVLNSRFIYYNLPPPSPYKIVDTKVEAKKYLRLPSYSLDDLCDYFNIGRKVHHEGFSLWLKCMDGDMKAWRKMLYYNKNDTLLMEKLYLRLRPYIKTHPIMGMLVGKIVCPNCGSKRIQSRGYSISRTRKYRRFQCQNCAAWSRTTINVEENRPLVGI